MYLGVFGRRRERRPTTNARRSLDREDGEFTDNLLRLGVEDPADQAPTYFTRDDLGRPLGLRSSEGRHYFLADKLGSVVALTDAGGAVSGRYRYDPYGELDDPDPEDAQEPEELLSEDAKQNPFRFEGFYYDSAVKTYDMQAREYRPDVGRFLSADRFEAAGMDLALQSDPLTQNRYAFAGGNPVSNIEFDGHWPCSGWECGHHDHGGKGGGKRGGGGSGGSGGGGSSGGGGGSNGGGGRSSYSGEAAPPYTESRLGSPDARVADARAIRERLEVDTRNPHAMPYAGMFDHVPLEELKELEEEFADLPQRHAEADPEGFFRVLGAMTMEFFAVDPTDPLDLLAIPFKPLKGPKVLKAGIEAGDDARDVARGVPDDALVVRGGSNTEEVFRTGAMSSVLTGC